MRQTAGVIGLLLLLIIIPFALFILGSDTGLAKDASCCVGVPDSQYAFKEGRKEHEWQEHRRTANRYRNEPLLPAVMKCSLGFFTPIWEKSWFAGRITAPSTACRERQHIQTWSCSVFPQITRFSSLSQLYLIDWYSSLSFLLLQVPHCAYFVSARATNKVHIHIWCLQIFFLKKEDQFMLWLATCLPDHGVTI